MRLRIFNRNDDKLISIAVVSYLLILAIQLFVLITIGIFGVPGAEYTLIFSRIAVGFVFILALPSVIERKKLLFVRPYLVAIFIYLLHFLIFPSNRNEIILNAPFMFMFNIPSFIYVTSIRNYDYFKNLIYKVGFIILIINSYLSIMVVTGRIHIPTYSMALSYYMLIPSIMFFGAFIDRMKKTNLVFFLMSLFIMISFGSRGAIIGLAFYVLFKLFMTKAHTIKHILLKSTTIIVLTSLAIFYKATLRIIQSFLWDIGISSRTINSFLSSEVSTSGRDIIYTNMIGEILERPIIGYGIYGDRILRGNYAHNILIEISINFGIIIGLILIVLLTVLLIKVLLTKQPLHVEIVLIYFCIGFTPLLVSYSYLTYVNFWVFLGLLLQVNKTNKKSRKEKISNSYLLNN